VTDQGFCRTVREKNSGYPLDANLGGRISFAGSVLRCMTPVVALPRHAGVVG